MEKIVRALGYIICSHVLFYQCFDFVHYFIYTVHIVEHGIVRNN